MMRIFELARTPPQWLRVILAALLLGFALNSIAHVAHRHDDGSAAAVTAAHSAICNYCISFGALGDAPRHLHLLPPDLDFEIASDSGTCTGPQRRTHTGARPRAPPYA